MHNQSVIFRSGERKPLLRLVVVRTQIRHAHDWVCHVESGPFGKNEEITSVSNENFYDPLARSWKLDKKERLVGMQRQKQINESYPVDQGLLDIRSMEGLGRTLKSHA
ncbi:MAG: hypothetical protein R3F01_04045 [Lysobacteraceae bacterium]